MLKTLAGAAAAAATGRFPGISAAESKPLKVWASAVAKVGARPAVVDFVECAVGSGEVPIYERAVDALDVDVDANELSVELYTGGPGTAVFYNVPERLLNDP